MTQHSTRAASPVPSNSLRGRFPKRSWPARLVLVAALLLAVPFLFDSGSTVHAADNDVTGLTLTSLNPGELAITWDAPSRAPTDYRVTWKKSDGKWPSYKNDNTVDGGNAFPTVTSHTVTDLEEGAAYKVRVRARYYDGNDNLTESGPWSDPPVEITVAQRQLPAKPTGITYGASHNNALMFWTDPDDDSITGYQILRGPDAANLAVLTEDTGSTDASYSDDTVEPETQYFYAIRARNAGGLGSQSDPFSVTTGPAPVEPESDLAIGGTEFTLDGQMLDTTGACDESDITQITDDCTINIASTSVALRAVDARTGGTFYVKVDRDKAALDANPQTVAALGDFDEAGDSKDITFEVGRNLMLMNGGSDHFFRVNVVPYWELNGERLSKDSDCRDTTANAPAVGDITDADCVVKKLGDTAEVQFFNVIQEHFNVYVDVNETNVINEPSTTDLGSSFTVNLDAGDNLIRIRLAAKGNQPLAEVYDSDSFYYKVAETDFLVSNLGQTSETMPVRHGRFVHIATQFTTGSNPNGYTVSKVRLPISVAAASVTPVVAIYSNVSGNPGASLKTLINPASITVSTTSPTEVDFDAGDYELSANTSYWIVLEKPDGSEEIYSDITLEDLEDAGGATGWSLRNASKGRSSTGSYSDVPNNYVMQIAIKGELVPAVSTDATLSDLVLFDSTSTEVTLVPAFDSEVTEYTATVANEHTRGALDAQLNDVKAGVEFLDENDATIPIAGMAGDVRYINPNL